MRKRLAIFNSQLKYGKLLFLSIFVLDLCCLIISNVVAFTTYQNSNKGNYSLGDYWSVVVFMIAIDVIVTVALGSLNEVARRSYRTEVILSTKHIGNSVTLLSVILFLTKSGSRYSRVIVLLTYMLYYVLLIGAHTICRWLLERTKETKQCRRVLLMTTDGFLDEAMGIAENKSIEITGVFLLKSNDKYNYSDIHVVDDVDEAKTILCWLWTNEFVLYGVDTQMIPMKLISACNEMSIKISVVDFEYRVLNLKRITAPDSKAGTLSFLEGKHDVPFPIRRVYWITETEAGIHRGFHAHKLNCQLLYCPYGKIDIKLDNGLGKKDVIRLEGPDKGLLLMPGLWREMIWLETGSVLCVIASEYYDADEYIRDYDKFLEYKKTPQLSDAGYEILSAPIAASKQL